MVSKLMLNVPGTSVLATTGTAFAEARSANILRAAAVERIDAFKWLEEPVGSLEGLSVADAQVLATRGMATLRALALAPPAAADDLAPGLQLTVHRARAVIRAATERHGISLAQ
ncbi:MAG: hypothetical protein ACAI38_18415 [Myxococcota bacterium]